MILTNTFGPLWSTTRKQMFGATTLTLLVLTAMSSAHAQRTNIALVGGGGWNTVPVAFSNGNGTFNVTNDYVGDFASWAISPGVKVLRGDFNGNGHTDIALVGGSGWNTIPVAFSNGNGTFSITNDYVPNFPSWAVSPGVQVLTGDFNGDGRTDIALIGGAGWNTIPIAFSNGNGTFTVTNDYVANVPSWVVSPGVKVLTGDFNGDGKTDIALVGGSGWYTIPVAFSTGAGTFNVTNDYVANFPTWVVSPGVKVLTGDFNGDGKTDIALVGGSGWSTIPVAFSTGAGTFNVTNDYVIYFPGWAVTPGVHVLTGDFNGDGRTDIALVGGGGWDTIPVAFSTGSGTFNVTNDYVANFPTWAISPGVDVLTGDFNGDGRTDFALVGGAGWSTIPVAFSTGSGTFNVTNDYVANFPTWAVVPGVKVLPGRY